MESYELLGEVGKGSFGTVYKVKKSGKIIALKVIKLDDPVIGKEAENEVKYLKEISDPCIPSLACYINSTIIDNKLYLETDFISGQDLNKFGKYYRDKGLINLGTYLLAIIGDLIPAIKYLHDKDIIHRDIKPENIIINDQNRPILIDVGLACTARDSEKCDDCCPGSAGTPLFMSPETVLNRVAYPISDIWSLGATIYHTYNGRYVFSGNTFKQLKSNMISKPVPELNSMNPKLNKLIKLMLVRNYENRLSTTGVINFLNNVQMRKENVEEFVEINEDIEKPEYVKTSQPIPIPKQLSKRSMIRNRIDEYLL